ncbi:MoeZ/MoeB [Penicillium macrosclerotiorum]|uniref:MoeZ/MoeB n=1 Tax=Penicillium macrosclerotiorum TaxID=303699 RepID=UPI002547ADC5|nr:MoeZ/MoeB [Penicillium macrosclerotiorum]KAJ5682193.1 MoeZ/MoeB [Penicillium macrosclerotiorum]
MGSLEDTCASLRAQIAATEAQLAGLKRDLAIAEETAANSESPEPCPNGSSTRWPLHPEEYKRYGRQMIVSQMGLEGQLKLRAARVLLVGAGGLGCPAAQYLAGAGVGTLGLIDGDTVEVSNLHRQVLHRSRNVGKYKVDSAIESLRELNPHPTYIAHRAHLTPSEAPAIFDQYDLILDCTDNPATRYLISDTAVLLGKPLVSASALRTEGQLMVLNNPPRRPGNKEGGPCYRCVFPKPPPADSVVSCADGGILGPVVGTMGVLQALEAIKVITATSVSESPSLHIFSAFSSPLFRTIRLRPRRPNCAVCSNEAAVTRDTITSGSTDYVFFCGSANLPALLDPEERISALEYSKKYTQHLSQDVQSSGHAMDSARHTVIDVRDKAQFGICNLEHSINIPISRILATRTTDETPSWLPPDLITSDSNDPIYVVCRLGNDSQIAVKKMKELGLDRNGQRFIGDIRGGFRSWREQVDPEWPEY